MEYGIHDNATRSEVFHKVVNHLLDQNESSQNGTICVYRSPEGLACAIGCLIDDTTAKHWDDHYRGETGIRSIYSRLQRSIDPIPKWLNDKNLNLLTDLQNLHDIEDTYTKCVPIFMKMAQKYRIKLLPELRARLEQIQAAAKVTG